MNTIDKLKKILKKKKDYTNHKKLAEDVWLFLTNEFMPHQAVINKKAFMHEVKAMLQCVAVFTIENHSNILDGINDEYGCNNVSRISYDQNLGRYYVSYKNGIKTDEFESLENILKFFKEEDASN